MIHPPLKAIETSPTIFTADPEYFRSLLLTLRPNLRGFSPFPTADGWHASGKFINCGDVLFIPHRSDGYRCSGTSNTPFFSIMMRGSGEVTRRSRTAARGSGSVLPHINDHISMQVGADSEVVAIMYSLEALAGAIGAFLPENPTLAIRGVEADPERYDFSCYRQNILSLQKTIGAAEPLLLDEGSYRREAGEMLLLSLAQALTDGLAVGPTPKGRRHFMRAIDFIEAHFIEEIRIAAIADAAGCSIRQLQDLFRALEGRTIVQHITARRLAHARSLLLKSAEGHSVTSAALDSGFSHFGLFARQYRTAFGELPSATRSAERAPRRGC